jgi:uncharacterized membrane protein YfhO
MVFGYYGTSSYSSFNNLNYIKFLMAVDAIDSTKPQRGAQWAPGLFCCPLLQTFACEKYVITDNPVPFQVRAEYEFVRRYGDIHVFRNNFSLPLGVILTNCISEDTFFQLPREAKAQALLNTAVLSDTDAASRFGILTTTLAGLYERMRERSTTEILSQLTETSLRIQSFKQTEIKGVVRRDQSGVLVFQMPFDAGWHSFVDGRSTPVMKADVGLLGVLLEAGLHTVQLTYRPPLLVTGTVITVVSSWILAFGVWRWPRLSGISCE